MKIFVVILLLLQVNCISTTLLAEQKKHENWCPGYYCSRVVMTNGNLSDCGACPSGWQRNDDYICEKCQDEPDFYTYLYLGFMVMLIPAFHFFVIDYTVETISIWGTFSLHLSALAETLLAVICTLLVSEPKGTFGLISCPIKRLSDWYSVFHNPTIDYSKQIHCTYQVIYPLYSIVMMYDAFCLLFLLLIRPFVIKRLIRRNEVIGGRMSGINCCHISIYAALYALPIFIVIQALFAGLIYYSFPYVMLASSLVTNALHFASHKEQTPCDLLRFLRMPRNLLILVSHWILHVYALVGIIGYKQLSQYLPTLAVIPFPAIFYILTVYFTDPNKLDFKRD